MPKRKGSKGGNPEPVQTAKFLASQFDRLDKTSEPLGRKTVGVRLFKSGEEMLYRIFPESKERAAWLRSVIQDALNQKSKEQDND